MNTARTISWEIRDRRLVEGTLVDQHVATGFGPDAAAAIRWARRHMPVATSAFPDEDIRAIPDPLGPDFGAKAPVNLPVASPLLASLVVLVCCYCIGCGRQHSSPSPDGFINEVGSAADLPSQSDRGMGNYFDRDLCAGLLGFAFAAGIFVWAGKKLDAQDKAESSRRLGQILNDLNRTMSGSPAPGALRDFPRPADPNGAGERRGFSQ